MQAAVKNAENTDLSEYSEEIKKAYADYIEDANYLLEHPFTTSEDVEIGIKLLEEAGKLLKAPEPEILVTEVFEDVPEGKWYVNSIQYVYDKGLMSGSGSYFNPMKNVTRAQLVTTIYRLAGSPKVTDYSACNDFVDVEPGKYYTDAVCWAYKEGIATGNNGKFDTTGNLTRQQMAAFFFRFADVMGYDISDSADFSAMLNADKVSGYAVDAVKWAVGSGLISGSETKDAAGNVVYDLNPRGNTTRAQLSAILQRFCEKYVND